MRAILKWILVASMVVVGIGGVVLVDNATRPTLESCLKEIPLHPDVARLEFMQQLQTLDFDETRSELWFVGGLNQAAECGREYGPEIDCDLAHIAKYSDATPDDVACVIGQAKEMFAKSDVHKEIVGSEAASHFFLQILESLDLPDGQKHCTQLVAEIPDSTGKEFFVAHCSAELARVQFGQVEFMRNVVDGSL